MIGLDLVDLRVAKTNDEAGFRTKISVPAEASRLKHLPLWVIWAAKEALYKASIPGVGLTPFLPVKQKIWESSQPWTLRLLHFFPELKSSWFLYSGAFRVEVVQNGTCIIAVAYRESIPVTHVEICLSKEEMMQHVRTFLGASHLALDHFPSGKPYLHASGIPCKGVEVSISHHGDFVGYVLTRKK